MLHGSLGSLFGQGKHLYLKALSLRRMWRRLCMLACWLMQHSALDQAPHTTPCGRRLGWQRPGASWRRSSTKRSALVHQGFC